MPRDPKSPQLPAEVQSAPRRKYAVPRLKQLGSVRDLTLGSPAGRKGDGTLAKRA